MVRASVSVLLVGGSVVVGAPSALASTGSVSGGVLTYTANASENNDVAIWPTSATPGAITLDDYGTSSLVAGAGCTLVSGELRCTGVTSVVLNLGSNADYADWTAVSVPVTYNAGPGADEGYGGGGDDSFAMSTGDDYVEAGDGADTIEGSSGWDYALGQAGDDVFDESSDDFSSDYLYGGSGVDTADYSGRTERVNISLDGVDNDGEVGEDDLVESDVENVVGGAGNDDLTGNDLGANALSGGDGNDALVGLGGADTLDGGSGEDALSGAGGADSLDGGADGDVLTGDSGADVLTGGDGNDDLAGGTENDTLDGGAGDDDLLGESGDDTLSDPSGANAIDGGVGDDTLSGGTGDETIFGREGSDIIDGGDGADTLKGGADVDILDGGLADDTLDGGTGADVLGGGDGTDEADYSSRVAAVTVTLDDLSNDGEVSEFDNVLSDVENLKGGFGSDSLTGDADANVLTDGSAGADSLVGGGGDDTLTGTGGDDSLSGGDGSDVMRGGTGNDTFAGGAGTDEVTYADHSAGVTVSIDATANDGSTGEADNVATDVENVTGTDFDDTLVGSSAANTLDAAGGNDTLQGLGSTDGYVAGPGTDTVSYKEKSTSVSASLDGVANDGETNELENLGDDVEKLVGGSGNDTLSGNLLANTFQGGGGTDTVTYAGRSSDLSLSVDGVANDGAAGELDNVSADIENLVGGSTNDVLTGDADANVLDGGPGADVVNGGDGDDTVTGGAGTDVLNGGLGADTASYAGSSAAVSVSLDGVANDGEVGELDNVAVDVENLIGGSGNDVLTGSASGNVFDGGQGADTVAGLGGIDTITYASRTLAVTVKLDANANDGQSGELDKILTDVENVIGGKGADSITGSKFANVITGGLGADKLVGGNGNDTFYAKDGVKDSLNGGKGTDSAQFDKSDVRTLIEKTIK